MDERQSGTLAAKLDNFWYHYKWHTIVTVFVIFVILVCAIQCAGNTSYDIQILYAGNHAFGRTSEDGGYSEYIETVSSFGVFAKDYDENGQTNVTFLDLYLLTKDEIAEIESDPENKSPVSYQLLQENTTMLKNNLDMSEYYVCFLSERLFKQYSEGEKNLGRFAKIADYTTEGKDYDFVSEYGIRLSSLDVKDMAGINELDAEDTIVCLRKIGAMSSMFSKAESEEQFARSEDFMRTILAYTGK